MPVISTPRPPLNVFEAIRTNLGPTGQMIYETPQYRIPAQGAASPERFVDAAAVLTSLFAFNTSTTDDAVIEMIVRTAQGTDFLLITGYTLSPRAAFAPQIDKQVMKTGEQLWASATGVGDPQVVLHTSLIVNQKEEFTILP